jgi:hypothetical protein
MTLSSVSTSTARRVITTIGKNDRESRGVLVVMP